MNEIRVRTSSTLLALTLAALSLGAALAAAEFIARTSFPAPAVSRLEVQKTTSAFRFSSNPLLTYELKPNFRASPATCHNSFPFTNSDGQRDIERSVPRDNGRYRVLMLGDSVVAGHGECDLEKTIPGRVEHALDGVEVLNFGVGGYCTLSEAELLRVKGLKYKPDLVALVFVANDYISANASAGKIIGYRRPDWINELFLVSHIFRRAALHFDFLSFKDEFFPEALPVTAADNVESGFKLLKTASAETKSQLLVFLWPFFTDRRIEPPTRAPFHAPAGPDVTELAAILGVPVWDLAPTFQAHFESLPRTESRRLSPRLTYTQGDGVHPSDLGAAVAAHAIAQRIRRNIEKRELRP